MNLIYSDKMEKVLIFFFVFTLISNCDSSEKKSKEKNFFTTNSTINSTLFTIKENYYEAKLSTASQNQRGKADGEYFFQRIGSLSYIISGLYQKPTIVSNDSHSLTNNYELNIRWSQQIKFDKVQQEVSKKMEEEFEYTVNSDTLEKQRFILFINDVTKLQKAKVSTNTDFSHKSSLEDGVWKIQATLGKFVNELSEISNQKVILNKDNSNTIYSFTLNTNDGLISILEHLRQDYGLAFEEETILEKHYSINFKNIEN